MDELERWREAFEILRSGKELNLHIYMNYLAVKPKLKKILDLYLMHKRVVPTAPLDMVMEKMIEQMHPALSPAKRSFIYEYATT